MRLHTPILIRPARIINLNFYPQLGNAACQTVSGRGTYLFYIPVASFLLRIISLLRFCF
jgi:hypothetical protein